MMIVRMNARLRRHLGELPKTYSSSPRPCATSPAPDGSPCRSAGAAIRAARGRDDGAGEDRADGDCGRRTGAATVDDARSRSSVSPVSIRWRPISISSGAICGRARLHRRDPAGALGAEGFYDPDRGGRDQLQQVGRLYRWGRPVRCALFQHLAARADALDPQAQFLEVARRRWRMRASPATRCSR